MAEVGPYDTLDLGGNVLAPWYMIPFDEQGTCTAPQTVAALHQVAASGGYTDIFFFSHGWNNTWSDATARYRQFAENFAKLRTSLGVTPGANYRPLLVGMFWPSITMVLPWEEAPAIAAAQGNDQASAEQVAAVRDLAASMAPAQRPRFYELINSPKPLTRAQAKELAQLLVPVYSANGSEVANGSVPTADELCDAWFAAARQSPQADTSGEFGFATGTTSGASVSPATGPAPAGWLDYLDPRWPLRLSSVWKMKDRAGVVGSHGVGPVLRKLLAEAPQARVHLIGHSFGCKVVMSALCHENPPRAVESALLLQPAVSAFCFAADATGHGQAGGFHEASNRVKTHIMLTFSHRDVPLYRFFHLAVRRKSDIGEVNIAAGTVSLYAALGGYGPQKLAVEEMRIEQMRKPEEGRYALTDAPKIIALNGGVLVTGHSDVVTPATALALGSLVFPTA